MWDQHNWRPGYEDDTSVGGGLANEIRAADADRDAAAERLRTHHAAGRLTDDEFQQRLEQSMAARILGELRALLADLPRDDVRGTARGGRMRGRRGPFGLRLLPAFAVVALVSGALARHAAWHHYGYGGYRGYAGYAGYHGHPGFWFPWPLLLVAGAAFVARRRARRMRGMRHMAARMGWA